MTDTPPTTPAACANCGAIIGEYIETNNRIWLKIGIVTLEYAHGKCDCGAAWHWATSDKTIERLIERRRLLADPPPPLSPHISELKERYLICPRLIRLGLSLLHLL